MKHRSANGTKAVPVTDVAGDGYAECCQELHNLHKQVSVETSEAPQRLYTTGYLFPYTAETRVVKRRIQAEELVSLWWEGEWKNSESAGAKPTVAL